MQYLKISFDTHSLQEYEVDILTYHLGEIGFDSFEVSPSCLDAYILKTQFNPESLKDVTDLSYTVEEMPDKNWNEEWEKNFFQPIVIDNQCVIHSSFHKDVPTAQYDIIIEPKMSFGTGHHQTTSNMLRWILQDEMQGKDVLDMGCGTGVLGILAAKRGAQSVMSVDIDDWCYENAQESATLNQVTLNLACGGAETIEGHEFDVILANINRNILLNDMHHYVATLRRGGSLYMSGFYTEDIPVINTCAQELGLHQVGVKEKNNWVAVKFVK